MSKKTLAAVLFLLSVSIGCAQLPMKQCDSKVTDADVYECKDQVQGHYWRCDKNQDLMRCQSPQ